MNHARYIKFHRYGSKWGPALTLSDLHPRRIKDALFARAEHSGSEGCYVEVARWSGKHNTWCRFAHFKCFGGEVRTDKLGAEEAASRIADSINKWHQSHPLPIIYHLPNFSEPKPESNPTTT
jgi:hypothetical protein